MEQTDRQTDKATRWAFTAYEAQWDLFVTMPDIVAEWGWQEEICETTSRRHYQGYLRTKRQVRLAQLLKSIPKVHFEIAKNWDGLLKYCKKPETAVPGTQTHQLSAAPAMTMSDALIMVANNLPDLEPLTLEQMGDDDIINRRIKYEYWESVQTILMSNPNMVGLFTQPQYERAWRNTRRVWIHHAKLKSEEEVYNASQVSPPSQQEEVRSQDGTCLG
jgi:hypothetical protein